MKVVELKEELFKRGYKNTGNKIDLIERLKAVLILDNARNTNGESDEELDEEEDFLLTQIFYDKCCPSRALYGNPNNFIGDD
ncbi:hypothetical protein O3M35_000356 [Rhynocoris fuscipes]|uniref:SAP domain-containing protein n=1 Tax=Rhynocoris fuscipes TaxID=488301 RepID=A0AAW1DLD5_9HEMI